jgi:hypothetical protein
MHRSAVRAKAETPKPKIERTKGDLVPPDYVLRLMEHVGPTAAAKMIGTSPGTLHKARSANIVTRPFEMAARGIWHEEGYEALAPPAEDRTADLGAAVLAPTGEGIVTFLVAVPGDKSTVMREAIKAMGGRIYVSQD